MPPDSLMADPLPEGNGMHFFYLDESGCSGANLTDAQQPVFVMGGISVRDVGWNATHTAMQKILSGYFNKRVPKNFELHANELLSPQGDGHFAGHPMGKRTQLAEDVLGLLAERKHDVHLIGIDKSSMATATCVATMPFDIRVPYLCAFDYLITYINEHVKTKLGQTARGMVILDRKDQFSLSVDTITHSRRFEGPASARVKWIAEFSYPVDSRKNPMVQMSDLVVYCARRFLELDSGHHPKWPDEAKLFYAKSYAIIDDRVVKKSLVARPGSGSKDFDRYLQEVRAAPTRGWKKRYGVD